MKLDSWLNGFLIDATLYKGRFDEALNKIGNLAALDTGVNAALRKYLRLASTLYCQGLFAVSSAYFVIHCISTCHCITNKVISWSIDLEKLPVV